MSKPMKKTSQVPLEALTRDLLPETRAILSELTSLITSTIPEATQKVNLGWRSLNFSHPDAGYFCGLFPVDSQVVVAFEFGVLLPDPDGILDDRGCAKQVRYLPVRAADAIPRDALERLLRAAVALPRDRSIRIALAKSGANAVPAKPHTRKRMPS